MKYKLVGDQIDTADVTDHGATTTLDYAYDGPGGEMTCAGATDRSTCASGVKYGYDAFGRMTSSEDTAKPSADKPTYAYDGLDRRDWKCINGADDQCSGGTRTEYGYVGLSELVSSASRIGGGGTSFNYDYDSQGDRLGQDRVPSSGAHTFHSYFTDPNGTVIGLENADGAIPDGHTDTPGIYADRAVYDFDPYGQQEDSEGSLSLDAQDNPFRFEGFELDSGVQTYDMQARPYRPDLGRFTTPDRFEDSLGDFALQSDPLTQNRYAFGAGNPVNDIEFDGHCASSSGSTLYAPCRALPGTPKKTARKVNRRADAAGRDIDQRNEAASREADQAQQGCAGSCGSDAMAKINAARHKRNVLDQVSDCAKYIFHCQRGALLNARTLGMRGQAAGTRPGFQLPGLCLTPGGTVLQDCARTDSRSNREGKGGAQQRNQRGKNPPTPPSPPCKGDPEKCKEPMIGDEGAQLTSKTLLDRGTYRLDVENPAPGQRPGQLHLQDEFGGKYLYDFESAEFQGAPRWLQRAIAKDPRFGRALSFGKKILGEP